MILEMMMMMDDEATQLSQTSSPSTFCLYEVLEAWSSSAYRSTTLYITAQRSMIS